MDRPAPRRIVVGYERVPVVAALDINFLDVNFNIVDEIYLSLLADVIAEEWE